MARVEWERTGTSFIVGATRLVETGKRGGVSLEEAMWASRRHIQTLRSTDSRTTSEQSYWSGLGAQEWQEMSSTSFITRQIICCLIQIWDTIANFHLVHTLAQVLDVRSPPSSTPSSLVYIYPNPCVFRPHFHDSPRSGGESAPRRAVEAGCCVDTGYVVMCSNFKCVVASVIFYNLSVISFKQFTRRVSAIMVIMCFKKTRMIVTASLLFFFFSAQGFGNPIYVYCLLKYTWFFLRLSASVLESSEALSNRIH